MVDLTKTRARILENLKVLDVTERKIKTDMRQVLEPDSEERAVALENAEVLQELDRTVTAEIQLLRMAISRIDEGTYGRCNRCGSSISEKRLTALPYAPTCRKCAA